MELLSGNEAIARGAYEADVKFAAGYPGTPSTEILENISKYYSKDIYAQWSPNEKVALEVGIGAAFAGVRTLVTMKHVGLNVASDPLFTLAYTGLNSGLVIVSADDPELHSSQNEQDNRHYAIAAKVPILEPADSQECKDFLIEAYKISERFDTPIIFRTTTRVAHSKSVVVFNQEKEQKQINYFKKNKSKFVMIPAYARIRHKILEEKIKAIEKFNSEENNLNKIEYKDYNIGVITSGISYQYVKEVFPSASILKLSMIYPFPKNLVLEFASRIKQIYVIEELDRIIENFVKLLGINVISKSDDLLLGELTPLRIRKDFLKEINEDKKEEKINLPSRPPVLCAGCPHRPVFYILKKLKVNVSGDIGCYTLGTLPPLEALDTCICMGASIGVANGMQKVKSNLKDNNIVDTVAVIGDSTFIHSGITGLVDIIYNNSPTLVLILDNNTTAMTGHQEHPGTGSTLNGYPAAQLSYKDLAKAIGIKNVSEINPFNIKELEERIKEYINKKEPALIITKSPCVLITKKRNYKEIKFISEKCKGCKICLTCGCPALSFDDINNKIIKTDLLCNKCGLCTNLCKFEALICE